MSRRDGRKCPSARAWVLEESSLKSAFFHVWWVDRMPADHSAAQSARLRCATRIRSGSGSVLGDRNEREHDS